MLVEPVAGSTWNGWPDAHGIAGRMTVVRALEKHVSGADHRLMVVNGRFIAAIRREPSFMRGDGHSTVAQLIDQLNVDRSSNLYKAGICGRLPLTIY